VLPVSTQNFRSLRSINIEKHFKVSHNKESHKVKVLARIYFSIIGLSIDRGRGEETVPVSYTGNGTIVSK
jgi:hypothetical protein